MVLQPSPATVLVADDTESVRADDILTKPVGPHELRARVRALSRVKQAIDALEPHARVRAPRGALV